MPPRAILLAMITMRKSIHGFAFLCGMGLSLAALLGHWSYAIKVVSIYVLIMSVSTITTNTCILLINKITGISFLVQNVFRRLRALNSFK